MAFYRQFPAEGDLSVIEMSYFGFSRTTIRLLSASTGLCDTQDERSFRPRLYDCFLYDLRAA
jgi:hypothetical protein